MNTLNYGIQATAVRQPLFPKQEISNGYAFPISTPLPSSRVCSIAKKEEASGSRYPMITGLLKAMYLILIFFLHSSPPEKENSLFSIICPAIVPRTVQATICRQNYIAIYIG